MGHKEAETGETGLFYPMVHSIFDRDPFSAWIVTNRCSLYRRTGIVARNNSDVSIYAAEDAGNNLSSTRD